MMLGHLMEWLYGGLGGIWYGKSPTDDGHADASTQDPRRKIVIAPQMVGSVTWARTSLQTPLGPVACRWTSNAAHTQWTVECDIPGGAAAEVRLPDGRVMSVGEGHSKFDSAR